MRLPVDTRGFPVRATIPRQEASATANRLLLAALLLCTVLLGATELGRLSTEVRAVAALIGAALVVLYLRNMPQANDLTDRMVLVGLLLFLVTCVTSSAMRASFEAATSAVAYVAAFYLARGALADERNRRLAITLLGLIGFVIGVTYLIWWGSIWARWMTIAGLGAPPFNLDLPYVLYRHQYLVGMLAAMLLPATIELARRPIIWPVGLIGAGATLLVAFMSGGRTVWLAGVVAGILALLGTRRIRLSISRTALPIAVLAVVAVGFLAIAPTLLTRLGATSTIELRWAMWSNELTHWLMSPVVGFGPGSFPTEFATTGYYSTFDVNVPHGHNALIQSLFEGGLVGFIGLGLVCFGGLVGAVRGRNLYWPAVSAITFFAAASLTDNPTVVPFLIAPLIVWAAMANPRSPSASIAPRPALRFASLGMAAVVGGAVAATLVGAIAFDRAREAAASGDAPAVIANLQRAVAWDPSFAIYYRELGIWLDTAQPEEATRQIATSIALNPSDSKAARSLAVLYARAGEREGAVKLTSRLTTYYGTRVESWLTSAYVSAALHDQAQAHDALVSAVRLAPWVTASPEWKQVFPDADTDEILLDAYESWQDADDASPRNLQSRAWLAGLVGSPPPAGASSGLQLQSAVLACRRQLAEGLIEPLTGNAATDLNVLAGELLFQNAFHSPVDGVEILFQFRDPSTAQLIANPPQGALPAPDSFQDIAYYDRIPLSPRTVVILPSAASGLSAWLRDPLAAARAGAPDSGLASCDVSAR